MEPRSDADGRAASAAVVVPVKAFTQAKVRLAPTLDPVTRADLARLMATIVLQAARPLAVTVVCDDPEVQDWARHHGVEALWTPRLGLNGAVEAGVSHLAERGIARAIVVHADLPLATDLTWLADLDGVTLVPDRHEDGTNVLGVPTEAGFRFAYGVGSFASHQGEAARLGLDVHVVHNVSLGWDVDVAADLDLPPDLHLPVEVRALLTRPMAAPAP